MRSSGPASAPASAGLAASFSSGSWHLLTLAGLDELAAEVLLEGLDDGVFAEGRGGGGCLRRGLLVFELDVDRHRRAEDVFRQLLEGRPRVAHRVGGEGVGEREDQL